MMCHCRFVHGNKCPTLAGMLIMKEDVHVGRTGICGKSLLPVQFCCEPLTAPQNKFVIFLKKEEEKN